MPDLRQSTLGASMRGVTFETFTCPACQSHEACGLVGGGIICATCRTVSARKDCLRPQGISAGANAKAPGGRQTGEREEAIARMTRYTKIPTRMAGATPATFKRTIPDVESSPAGPSESAACERTSLAGGDGKSGVPPQQHNGTRKGEPRKGEVLNGRVDAIVPAPVKRGRPRLGEVDRTIERAAPWVALGMSRATWYKERRAKASKGKKE